MFHRSQRLLLRPVWPEDWRLVLDGIADEGVVRNLASAPWPYREEDARAFTTLPTQPQFPRFLITRASDAALVGCTGIAPDKDDPNAAELGYWIAREHWGQGYATEAGRAVLQVANSLGHTQLVASHFIDNPASGKVLEKLGFEPTGVATMRHSCGRGEAALAREYKIDLARWGDPNPTCQQAA